MTHRSRIINYIFQISKIIVCRLTVRFINVTTVIELCYALFKNMNRKFLSMVMLICEALRVGHLVLRVAHAAVRTSRGQYF